MIPMVNEVQPKSEALISTPPTDCPTTLLFLRWARRNPGRAAGRWWERPALTATGSSSGDWRQQRDGLRQLVTETYRSIGRSMGGGR